MRESSWRVLGEGLLGLKRWVELPETRQEKQASTGWREAVAEGEGSLAGRLWGGLLNLCQEKLGAIAGPLRRGENISLMFLMTHTL